MKPIILLILLPLHLFAVDLPSFNSLTQTQKEALQHVAAETNKAQTNTVWTGRSYYDVVVIARATNELARLLNSYVAQHKSALDASVETNAPLNRIRARLPEILSNPAKARRIEAILDE